MHGRIKLVGYPRAQEREISDAEGESVVIGDLRKQFCFLHDLEECFDCFERCRSSHIGRIWSVESQKRKNVRPGGAQQLNSEEASGKTLADRKHDVIDVCVVDGRKHTELLTGNDRIYAR